MKTTLYLSITFILSLFIIVSCSNNEEAVEEQPEPLEIDAEVKHDIPPPTFDWIKVDLGMIEKNITAFGPMHTYLQSNYTASSKDTLSVLEGTYMCSFRQRFAGGIVYQFDNCAEAGNVEKIVLPKIDKEVLEESIEQIYGFGEFEHKWSSERTVYAPVGEFGCTIEIEEKDNNWILNTYCGS